MYFPESGFKMKVLVICGKSIGDTVFSTPVIRALKVQLDDPEIHILTYRTTAFLTRDNPYVTTTHLIDRSIIQTLRNLNQCRFDLAVNLSTCWKSRAVTALLIGTPAYSMRSVFWKKWLMVNLKINHISSNHAVDRMMQLLSPLGIKTDQLGLDYFLPDKDKVERQWLPDVFRRGFVVFCLSAPYLTRKLPLERMIELCDKINKPVILLGSVDDADSGEVISGFFSGRGNINLSHRIPTLQRKTVVYNACGKFNFNQMASLIKQSWAVFTFDNDFVPVASAFRKEVFGLWGNTSPLFGKYPYRTRYTTLESNHLQCRPCSSHGYDECPKGHFRCMRDMTFDFYLP